MKERVSLNLTLPVKEMIAGITGGLPPTCVNVASNTSSVRSAIGSSESPCSD